MLEASKIILLGIIQGLTEFLPISSSGHVTILYNFFDIKKALISLQIYLHLGTSIAVLIFLFKELKQRISVNQYLPVLKNLVIGSIPAGIVGIFFREWVELSFQVDILLPLFFFINSIILFSSTVKGREKYTMTNLNPLQALLIGFFQVLAIVPGISRSGSTITGGLLVGLKKDEALLFSLLLSLVAVWGASFIELFNSDSLFFQPSLILGIISAFITGYISLWIIKKTLAADKFYLFGIYTLILAILLWLRVLFT